MTSVSHSWLHRELRGRRSRSHGIVLVLALILLVVMTVSSVVAMRAATSSDMVSQNLRAQNLALQAAEIALRYCEGQIINNAAITLLPAMSATIVDEWRTEGNWGASNKVPAGFLGTSVSYDRVPECIVRRLSYEDVYTATQIALTTITPEQRGVSAGNVFIYRITARGFSPDYQRNAAGVSISGAEAWVQSTIRAVL